jgi:hypothetical protein
MSKPRRRAGLVLASRIPRQRAASDHQTRAQGTARGRPPGERSAPGWRGAVAAGARRVSGEGPGAVHLAHVHLSRAPRRSLRAAGREPRVAHRRAGVVAARILRARILGLCDRFLLPGCQSARLARAGYTKEIEARVGAEMAQLEGVTMPQLMSRWEPAAMRRAAHVPGERSSGNPQPG